MITSIKELLHALYNVQGLIQWGGTLLVCAIVFAETGLFAGFFLPGDSLLVTAGVLAGAGQLPVVRLAALVTLCAIAGDQLGYWIGRRTGQALYSRRDSLLFRRKHLERAHQFYEANGGKTIVLARFVPIVRTFCPPVAGAARMNYRHYLAYDVVGGIVWVGSMIFGGYFLGSVIPNVSQKIHWVIAIVVFLSLLPAIVGLLRARYGKGSAPPLSSTEAEQEQP
jgi:membrane-associated protein